MDDFLVQATHFFLSVKAPDLKEQVDAAMDSIKNGSSLESKQKKLLGFILFGYTMALGPQSFAQAERVSSEIGVQEEMLMYAKDWINYPKKK